MQINEITESKQQLDELIPLVVMGAGAAWTAYDAWQMKRAYDRGEISGADVAKAVGTDIAATIIGGVVAKVAGKGWKYGKKIFGSKKAAQDAAMANVAKTVNARSQSKNLVVPPKPPKQEIPLLKPRPSEVTPPSKSSQPIRLGPRTKSGEDEVLRPGEISYDAVQKAFVKLMQKDDARALAKTLAKSSSPAEKAKLAADKALKLAKYKETGNAKHLRGLSPQAVYDAGGADAMSAVFSKSRRLGSGKK